MKPLPEANSSATFFCAVVSPTIHQGLLTSAAVQYNFEGITVPPGFLLLLLLLLLTASQMAKEQRCHVEHTMRRRASRRSCLDVYGLPKAGSRLVAE